MRPIATNQPNFLFIYVNKSFFEHLAKYFDLVELGTKTSIPQPMANSTQLAI